MSAFQKLPKRFHPDFRVPGKKPVGPVEINDPGILEAYALSNAATALNLRDMVGGGMVSPSGVGVTLSSGANGKFLAVRSDRYYDVSSLRLRNLVGGGNPFAVLFDICPQQEDVNGAAWGFGGSDDLIFYPSGGSGRIRVFWRKVGSSIIDVNVPDNIVGQRNQYIFTSNGVDDHRMYFNGRLVDSSTSNGVAGPFSSGPYLCAWAESPGNQNLDLDLYGYVVLDRLVSEAEAKALHKDLKGQLLKPANDYGYFIPSSVGDGGIDAALAESSGAAILSGAGIVTDIISGGMAASIGAATITGDAIAEIDGSLIEFAGAATISAGGSPGINADLFVSAGASSMSAAGSSVDSREGDLIETLGASSVSGSATLAVLGELNEALGQSGIAASGESFIEAVLAASLNTIQIASSGSSFNAITAALNESLDVAYAGAAGSLDVIGALNANMGVLQINAAGESAVTADLIQYLRTDTLAAGSTVYAGVSGDLSIVLNSVDLRAQGAGPFTTESSLYFRGKLAATITYRGSLTSELVFRSKLN